MNTKARLLNSTSARAIEKAHANVLYGTVYGDLASAELRVLGVHSHHERVIVQAGFELGILTLGEKGIQYANR